MRRIVLSTEARRDLRKVWWSIAPDNRDAADEMCEKIHDAVELIAQMPGIGHNRIDVPQKKYRFWAVKPFVIGYRVSSNTGDDRANCPRRSRLPEPFRSALMSAAFTSRSQFAVYSPPRMSTEP